MRLCALFIGHLLIEIPETVRRFDLLLGVGVESERPKRRLCLSEIQLELLLQRGYGVALVALTRALLDNSMMVDIEHLVFQHADLRHKQCGDFSLKGGFDSRIPLFHNYHALFIIGLNGLNGFLLVRNANNKSDAFRLYKTIWRPHGTPMQ